MALFQVSTKDGNGMDRSGKDGRGWASFMRPQRNGMDWTGRDGTGLDWIGVFFKPREVSDE